MLRGARIYRPMAETTLWAAPRALDIPSDRIDDAWLQGAESSARRWAGARSVFPLYETSQAPE